MMKKGLFLKNSEVAAAFDIIAYVEYKGDIELSKAEREVMIKIRDHILEVEKDWEVEVKDSFSGYLHERFHI